MVWRGGQSGVLIVRVETFSGSIRDFLGSGTRGFLCRLFVGVVWESGFRVHVWGLEILLLPGEEVDGEWAKSSLQGEVKCLQVMAVIVPMLSVVKSANKSR